MCFGSSLEKQLKSKLKSKGELTSVSGGMKENQFIKGREGKMSEERREGGE